MIYTTLRTRFGRTFKNPTAAQLYAAIQEMKRDDDKHLWASLTNQTGHAVTIQTNGRLLFTDASQKGWIYEMRYQTLPQALALWQALQAADLETIQSEPWEMLRADALIDEIATAVATSIEQGDI